jgi:SAM-dependent methyltransferase
VVLARDCGCGVIAVDQDEKALELVKERVRANSLADRVQIRTLDPKKLSFPDSEFEGIVADGRLPFNLEGAAKKLRRFIAPKGRLCLTYPVKVGRQPNRAMIEFWEKKLGEPLHLPREALQIVEAAGYEPQTVETLPDAELDEFYRSVEGQLGAVSSPGQASQLQQEIALHRAQSGRSTVTFALLIARRKEPGEKPPPSRSDG